MTTFPAEDLPFPSIQKVSFPGKTLRVELSDGRVVIVPRAWYPRLANAKRKQLQHYQLSGSGYGIHWPDLDEDLSVKGFLAPRRVSQPEVVRDSRRRS